MSSHQIIILGFMGSGKTTVAEALARRLNSTMIDLDAEIERTNGRSPRQIIEEEGEPVFRQIESRVLKQVLNQNAARVVALGGGAWTLPGNRDLIENNGAISVWLDTPFDLCWQRIVESGSERPLAQNESQARILYEERRPSYSAAKLHIDVTENKSADQLADEVIHSLKSLEVELNRELDLT